MLILILELPHRLQFTFRNAFFIICRLCISLLELAQEVHVVFLEVLRIQLD